MAIELTNPMTGDLFKAELEKALDKTGDTITGQVLIDREPVDYKEIISKGYADSLLNFIPGSYFLCEKDNQSSEGWAYGVSVTNGVGSAVLNGDTATPRANGKIRVTIPSVTGSAWVGYIGSSSSEYCDKYVYSDLDFELYCLIDGLDRQTLCKGSFGGLESKYYYSLGNKTYVYSSVTIGEAVVDIDVLKDKEIKIYTEFNVKNAKREGSEEYITNSDFSIYFPQIKCTFSIGNPQFIME